MFSKAFFSRGVKSRDCVVMGYHIEEKNFRKTLWKKVKMLKMSKFTFFHNVFHGICILKSFNSHISVVDCSFFEFGTVSKWCIREQVKALKHSNLYKEKPGFPLEGGAFPISKQPDNVSSK